MRPEESYINQPIRSLQTMLRTIAENDSRYHSLIPDGIYGPETVRAVSVFQRNHGLPVTGVTDQPTWDALISIHEPALIQQNEAHPLFIILNPGQVIRKGERSPYIHLLQAMLHVLSDLYESVGVPTHSGILDEATSASLADFQALSGLPMTGHLDKHTWKHLTLQFPLASNLPDR